MLLPARFMSVLCREKNLKIEKRILLLPSLDFKPDVGFVGEVNRAAAIVVTVVVLCLCAMSSLISTFPVLSSLHVLPLPP